MTNRYKYIDEKGEHMHTLDGNPLIGTSSVADVLAKPLTWWASGLAVKEFGVTDGKVLTLIKNKKATPEEVKNMFASLGVVHEKIKQMTVEEYFKLCDGAYRAHTKTLKEKAKEGTDLHAELERFIKDEMAGEKRLPEAYHQRIHCYVEWSRKNVKRYLWSEVNCYSEKHWVGGISDAGVLLNDGKIAVIDFKSSKEAYLSQFWQACGYALQIEENGGYDKDGNEIFRFDAGQKVDCLVIVPFGMDNPYPQFNYDVEGGKQAFLAELFLYKKLPRD